MDEKPNKKAKAMRDNTIQDFNVRLDRLKSHFPLPVKEGKPRCQVHCWATEGNRQETRNVMCYEDCCVSICIRCCKLWHTKPDLTAMKEALGNKFCKEMQENETRGGSRK